jgi:hypothetical protein
MWGMWSDGKKFYGNTIDSSPFRSLFPGRSWNPYITQGCYNSLSDGNKAAARSMANGIVTKSIIGEPTPEIIVECFSDACRALLPDPCAGVVCEPECVGTDRYATACEDGTCVRGSLIEANSTECGYVPPKPECTEGDKKPGHVCSGGKWVPYTPPDVPEEPEPEEGRLYVKFDFPYLDLLPGIPYEPWMWIPPGFKIVEV